MSHLDDESGLSDVTRGAIRDPGETVQWTMRDLEYVYACDGGVTRE